MILVYLCIVTALGYATSMTLTSHSKSWGGVWARGLAISLGLAGFNAIRHGMPQCIEHDSPANGSCIEYKKGDESANAGDSARGTFFGTAVGGTVGMLLLRYNMRRSGQDPFP